MYDDEIPHEMFNRLKRLVKKARALGSKKWIDHMLTERLMMTYTPMNYNIVALIRQDLDYKMMSFDNVLGWIIEGPEKATRGGVNGSQSTFLTGIWPMSLNQPDVPLY
jgi:hypothetical protein